MSRIITRDKPVSANDLGGGGAITLGVIGMFMRGHTRVKGQGAGGWGHTHPLAEA